MSNENCKEPTDKEIAQEIYRADSKLGTAEVPYTLSDKYYRMADKLSANKK